MNKKFLETMREIRKDGSAWGMLFVGDMDFDVPRRPKVNYIDQVIDGARKHFMNLKKVRQKSSSVEDHFNAVHRLARFIGEVSVELHRLDDGDFLALMEMQGGDSYYGTLPYDQALDVFLLSFPLNNLRSERIGTHLSIRDEDVNIAVKVLMAMMGQQLEEIMLIIARQCDDREG